MGVVRLQCHECGSAECALDGGESDETWIVCCACQAKLITFGQLHDEIARQARDYATASIRKSLGMAVVYQDNDVPVSPVDRTEPNRADC
jgi:hypothetical protein